MARDEKRSKDGLKAAARARLKVKSPGMPILPPYDILPVHEEDDLGKIIKPGDLIIGHLLLDLPYQSRAWVNRDCPIGVVGWHKIFFLADKRIESEKADNISIRPVTIIRFVDRLEEEVWAACNFADWAKLNYNQPYRLRRRCIPRMTKAGFTARFMERLGVVPVGDPSKVLASQLIQWLDIDD